MSDGPEILALPDKPSWLAARRDGIGSSDAAAVLAVSPYQSPLQVYAEKLQIVEPDDTEIERMEWGLLLEEPIAARYRVVTGRALVDPGRFTIQRSRTRPFMQATLDRDILPIDDRGPGLLEIKTTGHYKADEWEDGPPLLYQVQVQHQLAVTGYQWGSLAVLIGGQRLVWADVERNDRFIALLIEREEEFWGRLLRHEPPSADASEATKDILAKLYPTDTGATVALPGDAVAWDIQRLEAIEELKIAEEKKRMAENLLKAHIGEAAFGVLPDGTRYSWQASSRKAYQVAETTVRTLRRQRSKE